MERKSTGSQNHPTKLQEFPGKKIKPQNIAELKQIPKHRLAKQKTIDLNNFKVIHKLIDLIERNLDARLSKIEKTSEKNANLLSLVTIAAEKATQKLRNIQILEERESRQESRRNQAFHTDPRNSQSMKSSQNHHGDENLNLQSTIRSFFNKITKEDGSKIHPSEQQDRMALRSSQFTNSTSSNIILRESSYIQPSIRVSRRDSSKSHLPAHDDTTQYFLKSQSSHSPLRFSSKSNLQHPDQSNQIQRNYYDAKIHDRFGMGKPKPLVFDSDESYDDVDALTDQHVQSLGRTVSMVDQAKGFHETHTQSHHLTQTKGHSSGNIQSNFMSFKNFQAHEIIGGGSESNSRITYLNYNIDDTESSDFEKENVFQVRPQSNDIKVAFDSKIKSVTPPNDKNFVPVQKNPIQKENQKAQGPSFESSPFKNKSLTQLEVYSKFSQEKFQTSEQSKNTKIDQMNQMF